MDRREFTLQLYDGKVAPAPFIPDLGSVTRAVDGRLWRCSGCLMAWGVYGYTTSDARPVGDGCNESGFTD